MNTQALEIVVLCLCGVGMHVLFDHWGVLRPGSQAGLQRLPTNKNTHQILGTGSIDRHAGSGAR
ncbi:hypothetical protein ACFSUI_17840 [Ralstonia solanacearum]